MNSTEQHECSKRRDSLKRAVLTTVAFAVFGAGSLFPSGHCLAQERQTRETASAPEAMQFVRLNEQGRFELEDGTPFYALGVRAVKIPIEVHAKSSHEPVGEIALWEYATDEQLRTYFKFLRRIGATTVDLIPVGSRDAGEPPRTGVPAAWGKHGLDACGAVHRHAWTHLDRLLDAARDCGLRVTVFLFFRNTMNIYVNPKGRLDDAVQKHWTKEELAGLPSYQKRFLVEKRWLGRGVWAQVDLGEEMALDTIKLWHSHSGEALNSRIRENKVALSTTGEFQGEETLVFDSDRDGEYPETPAGRTISFKPARARYIRNSVSGISGGGFQYSAWNEIEAYSQAVEGGTKNLARGRPVTVSTELGPSRDIWHRLTDGKHSTGVRLSELFYTDRDAVACQKSYVRDLVSRLKGRPEVLGYHFLCEGYMPTQARYDWTNEMIALVRSIDNKHLIGDSYGTAISRGHDCVRMSLGTDVDFWTYSLYGEGGRTSQFGDYGIQADVASRYGLLGKPGFTCEGGLFSQAFWGLGVKDKQEETCCCAIRDLIWFQLTSGCPGAMWYLPSGKDSFYKSELLQLEPAARIMRQSGLAQWRRRRPEVGIQVDRANLWKHYPNMLRYASHFSSKGVDFDFTFDNKPYAVKLSTAEFSPQGSLQTPFRPAAGYHLKYFLDEGGSKALIHLRNCAGIEEFAREYIKGSHASVWLRTRKPAEARIEINLPQGQYELKAWNLDTGETTVRRTSGRGPVVLGSDSRDDFVILVQKGDVD